MPTQHVVGCSVDGWNGSNAPFSTSCRFRLGTPGPPITASNERCHRHRGRVVVFHGRGCRHIPGNPGPSLPLRTFGCRKLRKEPPRCPGSTSTGRLPAQCGRRRTGCIAARMVHWRHRRWRALARQQLAASDRGSPWGRIDNPLPVCTAFSERRGGPSRLARSSESDRECHPGVAIRAGTDRCRLCGRRENRHRNRRKRHGPVAAGRRLCQRGRGTTLGMSKKDIMQNPGPTGRLPPLPSSRKVRW